MFKTLVTLLRGRAFDAEERLADRHALSRLDQQTRDAALAIDRSKKALAIAQGEAEEARHAETRARIADLESRAVEALKAGCADLARKAAENIARLEGDARAAEKAHALFSVEIEKLEGHVRGQTARLARR